MRSEWSIKSRKTQPMSEFDLYKTIELIGICSLLITAYLLAKLASS